MTEPSGLEYCVRDRDGRIVVAWRPVGELAKAVEGYAAMALDAGRCWHTPWFPEAARTARGHQTKYRALLGFDDREGDDE